MAAVLQTLLINAAANGHQAVAVRLQEHPSRSYGQTPAYGPEVMVKVVYADGTVDIVRLERAWSLFDAGVPVASLDCPDDPLPSVFIAAAMVHDATGLRHDLVVINRLLGQAQALASKAVVDGKPLGRTMRTQVLRYAQPQERARAKKASAKLTSEAQYGEGAAGPRVFASGVAAHLMESPKKRGLDPGRPAVQWSYKTVDRYGTETIVAASDPEFAADPVSELATAGVHALTGDEYGRTKPSELSANIWNRPLEWASRDTDGEVSELEAIPSPTYQKVQPAPDIEDWTRTMHPRPDDQRIWHDPVGEAARALTDNEMDLETALAYVWRGDEIDGAMELAGRWKAAGLNNRETFVRLCLQAGLTPQQVGDRIKRDRSTVRRINQRAEKKLQTGP
jgi:hypothetical protein